MNKYLLILLSFFLISPAHAEILQGRVVSVADGDTITVLDADNNQYKIRLSGIDAPERRQPFGQASKSSLSDFVFNKTVLIDWYKRDRNKRLVGVVRVNDVDVNLEQVKLGLAWHDTTIYINEQPLEDRVTYSRAHEDAKVTKTGLWIDPNPIPPWKWRKGVR